MKADLEMLRQDLWKQREARLGNNHTLRAQPTQTVPPSETTIQITITNFIRELEQEK